MRPIYREEPCKSALNRVWGMPFAWSLNPYMGCVHRCTFCYVRAFEQRADRPAGEAYGQAIRVKVNIVSLLRRELARPGWRRETVMIGAATDPYQPAEGRYRLTRGCLLALAAARTPLSIVTRGPLVVRDIDVLAAAGRQVEVDVNVSIPTLDEDVWRRTEPGTASPRQRLRAVRSLAAAGIRTGIGMAPILPGLSDRPEQLRDVVRAARDAGAHHLWANVVHLRPGTREHFLGHLARDWPEERQRYERLFADRAYLPRYQAEPILTSVARLRASAGIADRRAAPPAGPAEPEQLELITWGAPGAPHAPRARRAPGDPGRFSTHHTL